MFRDRGTVSHKGADREHVLYFGQNSIVKGFIAVKKNEGALAQVRQGKGFLSNKTVKWQINRRV